MAIVARRSTARASRCARVVHLGASAGCLVLSLLALVVPSAGAATTPIVGLGTSSGYAVLSGASVGNTVSAPGAPYTTLRGGLAVKPNTQPLGFPPGIVTGAIDIGNSAADSALADATAAYNEIATRTGGAPLAGALAGMTIGPGLYSIPGAVSNTTTVTLDAGGNPDAVFVFQVDGALAMAAGSHVTLAGGAQASHVFWQVNGAGAVGANASFAGTMIALNAVAFGSGTIVNGRGFALTGALTLDANDVYSAPPLITIDGGATAATADTTPTISGTTDVEAPALVTVRVDGQTLTAAPSGGAWSVTSALLANASYPVAASVTDGASNTSSATQSLTVDTVLPVVTLDGGPARATNDATPTIGGTSDVGDGSMVLVTVGSTTLSALVQIGGFWNVTPRALSDGLQPVTATVIDLAGNHGVATQTVTIDTAAPALTISGGATALTNDPTPTISGSAAVTSGTLVSVTLADETLSAGVQPDGSWSVTASALADGPHRVVVGVSDEAGNPSGFTQTLTVDTVSPAVTIAGGARASTFALAPTISGTSAAAPGTVVTLTVAGQSLTTLVQANGSWNTTPAPVGVGVWEVSATASDPAGNVGRAGQSLTVASPAAPGAGEEVAVPVAPVATPVPSSPPGEPATPMTPSSPSAPDGGSKSKAFARTTITPDSSQKLTGASVTIATTVTAPAGTRLVVTANGSVKIAGVSRAIPLTTRKRTLAAGHSATLTLVAQGTVQVARAVVARCKAAIRAGRRVRATITLTLVDATGHSRTVRRLVTLT
jgi:hypothetical protein